MDYETLTDADKLLLARDRLRGLESDHYRISITSELNKESRLSQLEEDIELAKQEIARLQEPKKNTRRKKAASDDSDTKS